LESLGASQSEKPCLACKIDFGRRIDYEGRVGKIMGFAPFASKPKKITITSLFIAASPLEFGSF
jgi:hypothetical protein